LLNNKTLPEYINGEIRTYCYLVERGKPAATIAIKKCYTDNVIKIISNDCHLKAYIENLKYDWNTVWIYKYDHILEVIKSLPQVPHTTVDHWLLGKLFGYDEESIHKYLSNRFVQTL
jgi:hypothetical protein